MLSKKCMSPKSYCGISIVDFMLQTMKVFNFAWLLKKFGQFPLLVTDCSKPLILSNYTAWNELKFISVQLYACWINTEWSSFHFNFVEMEIAAFNTSWEMLTAMWSNFWLISSLLHFLFQILALLFHIELRSQVIILKVYWKVSANWFP